MTARDGAAAADRLRRALLAFQSAQTAFLGAHRKAKALPSPAEVEQFWRTHGNQVEAGQHVAAVEVEAAFRAFSAAGLVAEAGDRHLVTEARRYLAEQ